jgi:hypothetical protein
LENESAENVNSSRADHSSGIEVVHSNEPFNEFFQNDDLMFKAFPHLFLLGKGLRSHGSLSQKDSRHLLMQFHGQFAACLRFVFLLFDQLQRHSAARIIAAKIENRSRILIEIQRNGGRFWLSSTSGGRQEKS